MADPAGRRFISKRATEAAQMLDVDELSSVISCALFLAHYFLRTIY